MPTEAPLAVPAGLLGAFAAVAFGLAIAGAIVAPLLARSPRFAGPWSALALLPYALLLVAAILAAASAVLGVVGASRLGVREIATGGLALVCATPVVGAIAVRLRYGPTGSRTFRHQVAANRVNAALLVALLVEVLVVTGFLIGVGVGAVLGSTLLVGVVFAALSLAGTAVATAAVLRDGDRFVLDLARARPARRNHRERTLRNVVEELALAAGMPAPEVYVVDVDAPNAFAVGRDSRRASIAVTRGLLETLDREELQGVVAHELAHVRNLDSRHGLLVALLVGAVIVLTAVFLELVVAVVREPPLKADSLGGLVASIATWIVISIVALAFAGALRLFAPLAARAVQAAVSRDREYLADATSVEITRNPAGLIAALAKLDGVAGHMPDTNEGTQHLWFVNPVREDHEGGRGWFDTHPSTADRIARLRALSGMGEQG